MNRLNAIIGAAVLAAMTLSAGCAVYPAQRHDYGYGPPPHAPAHGYRHRYQDRELVYDRYLGVYLVSGYSDQYYLDDTFYRHGNDGWYSSRQPDRDWREYHQDRLPPGLAKKYGNAGKQRGNDGDHGRDGH